MREEWVLGCGGGAWAIAADAGAWLDAERSPENYGPLRQVRCPPGASQVLGFARERERTLTHSHSLTHTHTKRERDWGSIGPLREMTLCREHVFPPRPVSTG